MIIKKNIKQENGKKASYIQISFDQYSHFNALKDQVHNYEQQVSNLEDQIKDLDSKLSTANADVTAKELLVKQHSKVAEEAVSGNIIIKVNKRLMIDCVVVSYFF